MAGPPSESGSGITRDSSMLGLKWNHLNPREADELIQRAGHLLTTEAINNLSRLKKGCGRYSWRARVF